MDKNRLELLKKAREKASQVNRNKRLEWINRQNEEINNEIDNSEFDLKSKRSILAALYWAEGAKTGSVIQFVNVDPKLILLFVSLLRQCYELDEAKFRVRLHLHYYHRARESEEFWSKLLNIPKSKFGKITWKSRNIEKHFRKNSFGICTIRYNSTYLQQRLISYALALGLKLS